MSSQTLLKQAKALPYAQRILLVEKIWDSVAEEQPDLPVSQQQKQQLRERLAKNMADPNRGESWEVVCQRIRRSVSRAK